MKRLVLGTLGTLLIATATTPALAEKTSSNSPNRHNNITEVQPFNLVYLAYQGYFADQGIPSNGAFTHAIKTKKVTATDLVESAIARGRLSPETLNDSSYLASVKAQLFNINNL